VVAVVVVVVVVLMGGHGQYGVVVAVQRMVKLGG
tara:strand:+ start:316 stop:417 length:102 start_codon:yes stop_codon:yes gene_type:complete